VSYIVGGGNRSAVRTAIRTSQMMHQKMRRRPQIILPPAPQVKEIVHEIAAATKSEELLKQFLEELKGLREDFEQERAERALREGPYSGIYRYAPANKAEWYSFLGFVAALVAVILPFIINKPEPPPVIIQSHDQEIVQQLEEINELLAEAEKEAPADEPSLKHKPKEHC
jgi:hypothetical protein